MWLLLFSYPVTQSSELLMDVAMAHSRGNTHLLALLHKKGMSQACSFKTSLLFKHRCPNPDAFQATQDKDICHPDVRRWSGRIWTAESIPHLKVLPLGYFLNTVLTKTNQVTCLYPCLFTRWVLRRRKRRGRKKEEEEEWGRGGGGGGKDMPAGQRSKSCGFCSWICNQQTLRTLGVSWLLWAQFPLQ